MRLVIEGNRAPAPAADIALIKALARGRQWADDLLSGVDSRESEYLMGFRWPHLRDFLVGVSPFS
jgi:hypothetical protein